VSELDKSHPIRRRYYRRVRNALLVAVAIHVAAFVAAPPYRPKPPAMSADPIRLLPLAAGTSLEEVRSAPAFRPDGGAPASETPAVAAIRPVARQEIRSEQILTGPRGESGSPEGAAAPGAAESEAPPVYYGYDTAPRAVKTLEPEYPLAARNSGFEGTVVINVNLDERGRILRAWVASANAPDVLVASALDAVYQFEFAPGLFRGSPVRSTVAIPFRFSLRRTT
jgi:protein TonB